MKTESYRRYISTTKYRNYAYECINGHVFSLHNKTPKVVCAFCGAVAHYKSKI